MPTPAVLGNQIHTGSHIMLPRRSVPETLVGGVANWKGRAQLPAVPYPRVDGFVMYATRSGKTELENHVPPLDVRFPRGPRMGGRIGSVDVWAIQGAVGAAADLLTLTDVNGLTTLTLGVTATGTLTGVLLDLAGTTVAEFETATAVAEGARMHFQFGWDSRAGTVGAALDGVTLASGEYSTAPTGVWSTVPLEFVTLLQGGSDFLGTHELTQLSQSKIV